jgi:hypothetical protein
MTDLLCSFAQKRFIYSISSVESNDKLYGGSPSYIAELSELIYVSMSATLQQLTALGEVSESSIDNVSGSLAQAKGALDLVNHIVYRMEMSAAVGLFINRLIELARKNKAQFTAADQKYYSSTVEYVVTILRKQQQRLQHSSNSSNTAASDHFADELITSLKQLT